MSINIQALCAFNDNYIWILFNTESKQCATIDPGDAEPVLQWLQLNPAFTLTDILITHHHQDHTAGVASLVSKTAARVFEPAKEKTMHNSIPLDSEHTVSIIGIFFKILDIPGHTLGHIAYYEKTQGWLFSGDTLFSGGCGRVLEGSYEQMHQSLIQLTSLPKATKIYCAHEYTLNNLKFALTVDPENKDLQKYLVEVNHLRKNQQSTIPSTLSLELKINPFLRLKNIESKKLSVEQETISNQEIFTVLRQLKNVF